MSRISLEGKNGRLVELGLDHAIGWFFQLWASNEEMATLPQEIQDRDGLLIDKDQMFTPRFGRSSMLALIEEHAVPCPEAKRVCGAIACDLDPGNNF